MSATKLKSDDSIALALELLEDLTTKHHKGIAIEDFCAQHKLSREQVLSLCDLVSTLADRQSGARVALSIENDVICLVGDVADLQPLRLTLGESMILTHVLNDYEVDDKSRRRLLKMLAPVDYADSSAPIASSVVHGSSYQMLQTAIEDGVRCIICYQSTSDTQPRNRTVDPVRLENTAESAYLLACDITASDQEPHRYRIDRISHVAYTDDSVEQCNAQVLSLDESLKREGEPICVSVPIEQADQLGWHGVAKREDRNGRAYLTVAVTSRTWLFDQIVSHAGTMRIEYDSALCAELVSYAQTLTIR